MKIKFSYDGKNYEVRIQSYLYDRIQPPDGRVLAVTECNEKIPPEPTKLELVKPGSGSIEFAENELALEVE